jgi:hypothetical protein
MRKRKCLSDPKTGGIRQRIAARMALESDQAQLHAEGLGSELVLHLLFEWSWGKISAPGLQEIAHKAYTDQESLLSSLGLSTDLIKGSLRKLASLGSYGRNFQNCHRELVSYLGEPSTPAPFVHSVPMLCQKASSSESLVNCDVEMLFFLPHVMFAHFYHHKRARFNEIFLGDHSSTASLTKFWQELQSRKDPRLEAHPMRQQKNWMRTVIPISVHGDGVPVLQVGKANTKSLEVYSFQSIFNSTSSTLKAKLLMTMAFNQNLKDESHTEIWRVLNWSLHWLYEGLWPRVDFRGEPWPANSADAIIAGEPLAGGLRCALWSIKGDLDFFA